MADIIACRKDSHHPGVIANAQAVGLLLVGAENVGQPVVVEEFVDRLRPKGLQTKTPR